MKNKITIKNSVKIIDDSYCIKKKKKDLDKVYNYLLSRSFDYFPEILDEDNENIYYKYINDNLESHSYNNNQIDKKFDEIKTNIITEDIKIVVSLADDDTNEIIDVSHEIPIIKAGD